MTALRNGERVRGGDHEDLWNLLEAKIELLDDKSWLRVDKVKAHMTEADVLRAA